MMAHGALKTASRSLQINKMIVKKIGLFLVLITLFWSCAPKTAPIDLDGRIRAYVDALPDTTTMFKMDVFDNLPFDWDHMAIINPYTPADSISNLPYINLGPSKASIVDYTYQEQFAQLVLSKDNKVLSVDTVKRDVVDFVMLKAAGKVNGIEILKRSQVRDLTYTRNLVTMGKYVPVLKE